MVGSAWMHHCRQRPLQAGTADLTADLRLKADHCPPEETYTIDTMDTCQIHTFTYDTCN